ncbi:hypothetical protein JNG37_09110 [Streptococcus suis]|nr:hypothetical protein [Streptococcus suis]
MSKHDKFILTPITSVLEEAVVASYGIGKGIESYSISDYIMQSLFLKMTGFQEQKMKCISWEIATNDFAYRRSLLANDYGLAEHSTYRAKNTIFQKLQESIANINNDIDFHKSVFEVIKEDFLGKEDIDIIEETRIVLKDVFGSESDKDRVNEIFFQLAKKKLSQNTNSEVLEIIKEFLSDSDFLSLNIELEKIEQRKNTADEIFETLKNVIKESKFNELCRKLLKTFFQEKSFDEIIKMLKVLLSESEIHKLYASLAKKEFRDSTVNKIIEIFADTNLAVWKEKNFDYFYNEGSKKIICLNQLLPKQKNNYSLFGNVLVEKYEILYNQRNRIAHNVISYQDNLPTLKTLQLETDESRNYFVWFAILVLIDKIFMSTYRVYQLALDEDIY